MFYRIISTVILWTATITVIVYLGSFGFCILMFLLSAAAMFEASKLLEKLGARPMIAAAQTANAAIFFGGWAASNFGVLDAAGGSLIAAVCVCALSISIAAHPYDDFFQKRFLPTAALILAIPFMLQWLSAVSADVRGATSEYTGTVLAVWILAAAKASDLGGYVIGAAFGRTPMSPQISPNKSWEGAAGGIFSSAAFSACIAWGFASVLPNVFTPALAAVLGAIIGAIAILSDLLESVLKRRAKEKDSGSLIPGIGGALDLADSLLLTAPVGALVLALIL